MRRLVIVVLSCFLIVLLSAQEENYIGDTDFGKNKIRMLGFNITGMVSQFMPFSQRIDQTGPFQFKFMGGGAGHLFNMQLGAGKIDQGNDDPFGFSRDEFYTNLVFGYARYKEVNEKFYHYFSQNMMFSSGFLNKPDEDIPFFQEAYIAFNAGWGVGYKLTPQVSLCTEIQFVFALGGVSGDQSIVEFIPPIGLFLVTHL